MNSNLGNIIKNKREEKKLTQQQLADLTDVSKSYINKIEHGEAMQPSLSVLSNIASTLQIDYMDLVEEANYSVDDILINQNLFNDFIYRYEATKKDIIPKYNNKNIINIEKVIKDYKEGIINNIDATYLFIEWTIQNEKK